MRTTRCSTGVRDGRGTSPVDGSARLTAEPEARATPGTATAAPALATAPFTKVRRSTTRRFGLLPGASCRHRDAEPARGARRPGRDVGDGRSLQGQLGHEGGRGRLLVVGRVDVHAHGPPVIPADVR